MMITSHLQKSVAITCNHHAFVELYTSLEFNHARLGFWNPCASVCLDLEQRDIFEVTSKLLNTIQGQQQTQHLHTKRHAPKNIYLFPLHTN